MYEECPHSYRAFNEDGDLVVMACDSWSCPVCARNNAYRWAERVRFGISLWPIHTAYFWTLTLPPWINYSRTGFRVLPGCWDRFRREIQKTVLPWHYAAFVELHQQRNLIPHFHIISLQPSPYRLKDLAVHCGFGYEAKDKVITNLHAARYVTKYASKQGYGMDRHFRRVRVSQSWPKLPKPAYDKRVYPPLRGERLDAYIRRIAMLTGESYRDLTCQWVS